MSRHRRWRENDALLKIFFILACIETSLVLSIGLTMIAVNAVNSF